MASITCEPTDETIASCNHCGRPNYEVEKTGPGKGEHRVNPTGLALYELRIPLGESGYSTQRLTMCALCLLDLSDAVHPWRASATERPAHRPRVRRGELAMDSEGRLVGNSGDLDVGSERPSQIDVIGTDDRRTRFYFERVRGDNVAWSYRSANGAVLFILNDNPA